MVGRWGIFGIAVGIFLMTATDARLVGLGIWWVGVLILVDSFIGDGLAVQFLWGIGVGVAVWGFTDGWVEVAVEDRGQLVVAAISLVLALMTVVRSIRSPQRPLPAGGKGQLQRALSQWDLARTQVASGQRLRGGLNYQDTINHLLRCLTQDRSDLMPLHHAMSAAGREGLPVMDQLNATRPLRLYARLTLAAAHLADPVGGQPALVAGAVAGDDNPGMDLNGDGPLSAQARIAGAAQARLLLARFILERPALSWAAVPAWVVGSGGPLNFFGERKRFYQAVLPSCDGMAPEAEARQLAQESVDLYTELCRIVPGYESERERAKRILARSLA